MAMLSRVESTKAESQAALGCAAGRTGCARSSRAKPVRRAGEARRRPRDGLAWLLPGTEAPARRRGVLLLVVLGMLAMFGLLALSFVLITGQARRGAEALGKVDQYADPAEQLLHQAAGELLRGSTNPYSVLGPHSLLEDLYGEATVFGTVASVGPAVPGGQLVQVDFGGQLYLDEGQTSPVPGSEAGVRVGSVLTVMSRSSRASNQSFRLTGYDPTTGFLQILCENNQLLPQPGDRFAINGVPFSGTGFGWDGTQITQTALLPNYTANGQPATGANEDYDAADYQNMALGLMLPDGSVPLPSFHRPELVRFWMNQQGATSWEDLNTNLLRQILLRPLGKRSDNDPTRTVHPLFTGSNPNFNPVTGPWDVDNDGDGIADSIWVDLGLPARALKDGRLYKPLFAILCLDLDGRLNLNAHGSVAQILPGYDTPSQPIAGPYAGPNVQLPLPRGEGCGPADVRLASVLANAAEVAQLLVGDSGHGIEGRYGETLRLSGVYPQGGFTLPQGSYTTNDDPTLNRLSWRKHFDFPPLSYLDTSVLTSFASPPDLWGRGAVALDLSGQPAFYRQSAFDAGMETPWWNPEMVNNPYRLDLSRKAVRQTATTTSAKDNPFSAAELERVLRRYDVDANVLASRLVDLAPSLLTDPTLRNKITTESADIPVPSRPAGIVGTARSVTELLRAVLIHNGVPANQVDTQLADLLAWDLLLNRRMDVNRTFGNGRDTNGNAVVDEWEEAPGETGFWLSNGIDVNGDGNVDGTDQQLARHLYARHLFVLAMLLTDQGYIQFIPPASGPGPQYKDGSLTDPQKRELTIRRIAQWAVNCADFRDADSAMTPFEYDESPFTDETGDGRTWDVDGIIATLENAVPTRRVVWGCEAPDLLLTEAFAMHDRRVADTAFDSGPRGTERTDPNNPDDDLDQPRIPQGSAFFELYCPQNPNNPVGRADLYTFNNGRWYLDLGKLAPPDSRGLLYPVWRMVITEKAPYKATESADEDLSESGGGGGANDGDSNNVAVRIRKRPYSCSLEPKQYHGAPQNIGQRSGLRDFNLLATPPVDGLNVPEIERVVWFTTQAPQEGANGHRDADRTYYNRNGNTLLGCGRYALVGPRSVTYVGSMPKNQGAVPAVPLGKPAPQRIVLHPAVSVAASAQPYPDKGNEIQEPMGIVVAGRAPTGWSRVNQTAPEGIGISVSEPLFSSNDYYPEPTEQNPSTGAWDAYGDLTETDPNKRFPHGQLDNDPQRPLHDNNYAQGLRTGTKPNFKTVFLQRLADPLAPYDPELNPYLTVDWSPIDLTVFNGEDHIDNHANAPPDWDPVDDNPRATQDVRFQARQRGNPPDLPAWWTPLWTPLPGRPTPTSAPVHTINDPNFQHQLVHTLGFLNTGYGQRWDSAALKAAGFPAPAVDEYRGAPRTPFPWLMWNNRPFTSALELLCVPSSHPARLAWEFSAASTPDPYASPVYGNQPVFGFPYGQLLNFFHVVANPANPNESSPPQFYRLLEYLEVPSRFLGTELFLNPDSTSGTAIYRQPFNLVSHYREPGKVNLNTITSPEVWNALLNGHAGPMFQFVVESRRGYGSGGGIADMDPNFPTRFANPFRSPLCAHLAPNVPGLRKTRPVNAGLLRATGVDPDNNSNPLLANVFPEAFRNTNLNAFFRYQGLSRLANLVTDRSNVYAVWITVGYFEVSRANRPDLIPPAQPDWSQYWALYPDGYWLGRELGSDTGEVRRHRAFFLIDRSIPAGFVRGKDLNVSNTILLERFIE